MLLQTQTTACPPANFWEIMGRISSIVTVLGIVSVLVGLISVWSKVKNLTLRMFSQRKIIALELQPNSGFRGLICCVSAPVVVDRPASRPQQIDQMIVDSEDLAEQLRDGPIGSILKAIEIHREHLKHCWLVASEESKPYFGPLQNACKKYFPAVVLETITVEDVYAKIDNVYDAVQNIFATCEEKTGLLPSEIITDVTGGTKIMSIAVAMACLDSNRQIQYVEQKTRKTFYKIDITWEKLIAQRRMSPKPV